MPFHSPFLESVTAVMLQDLNDRRAFTRQGLAIPAFQTSTGQDPCDSLGDESIVSESVSTII